MITPSRISLILASIVASCSMLLPSVGAEAKGNFDKILVFAGISACIEVDDPSLSGFFSFSDFSERQSWPAAPGEGWLIARYASDQNTGEPVPVDHIWIYPPSSHSGPLVYYQGLVNGSSEYDGKLFEGNPEAWLKLQSLVEASSRSASTTSQVAPVLATGLLGLCIGTAISFGVLRTRLSREHASA
jgi:hypothetical protein